MNKITTLNKVSGNLQKNNAPNLTNYSSWNVFDFLLNLFFPKDFFDKYLQDFELQTKQRKPDLDNPHFDQILVSSNYNSVEKLLHRAKFGGELAICEDFAKIMSGNLEQSIEQKIIPKPDLLIFVPADPRRLKVRGFHLPEILMTKISQKTKIPFAKILQKTKQTQAQTKLGRTERLVNLENCFKIQEIDEKIKIVCLVDDICTTGTTLNECAKILKQNYPNLEVFALVLASN